MIGKIREGMNGQQVANLLDDNFKYLDNKVDVGIQEITEDVTNFKDNVNNTLDTQLTKYEEAVDKLVDDSIIAADEEDITSDKGFAKFADRAYDPDKFSGKGYKILRKKIYKGKNILFQEDINEPNTIYEIRYDFDLNGQEITIPEGCVLQFEGGSLGNGAINFNNTRIMNCVGQIDMPISGTIFNNIVYLDWFALDVFQEDNIPLEYVSNKNNKIVQSLIDGNYLIYTTVKAVIPFSNYLQVNRKIAIIGNYLDNNNFNTKFYFPNSVGFLFQEYYSRVWFENILIESKGHCFYFNNIDSTSATYRTLTRSLFRNLQLNSYDGDAFHSDLRQCNHYSNFFIDIKFNVSENKGCFYQMGNLQNNVINIADGGSALNTIVQGHSALYYFCNMSVNVTKSNMTYLYAKHLLYVDSEETGEINVNINGCNLEGFSAPLIYSPTQNFRISLYMNNISVVLGKDFDERVYNSFLYGRFVYIEGIPNTLTFNKTNGEKVTLPAHIHQFGATEFINLSFDCYIYDDTSQSLNIYIGYSSNKYLVVESSSNIKKLCAVKEVEKIDLLSSKRIRFEDGSDLENDLALNTASLLYDNTLTSFKIKQRNRLNFEEFMQSNLHVNSNQLSSAGLANLPDGANCYLTNIGIPVYKKGSEWMTYDGYRYNLKKGAISQRPSLQSTDEGFEYYDTSLKKKILWNGTDWTNLDGTSL